MVIFDIFIRLITIVIKGIFFLWLAKKMSVEYFGLFILLVSIVSFSIYFSGLEFYAYAHRFYFAQKINIKQLASSIAKFTALPTLIVAIISSIFFKLKDINYTITYLLFFLVLVEMASSELIRLLRVVNKATISNLMNFIKSSLWMIPLLAIRIETDYYLIQAILISWILFDLFVVILSMIALRINVDDIFFIKLPKKIYSDSMKVLPWLFISTISKRSLISLDKIVIAYIMSSEQAASYGFFSTLTFTYVIIMDAAIIAKFYATYIKSVTNKKIKLADKLYKDFLEKITIFAIVFLFGYVICMDTILEWLEKPYYKDNKSIGFLLLIAYVISLYAIPYQYYLYAHKQDKTVMKINIITLAFFSAALLLAFYRNSCYLIAAGLILSYILTLALNYIASKRLAMNL